MTTQGHCILTREDLTGEGFETSAQGRLKHYQGLIPSDPPHDVKPHLLNTKNKNQKVFILSLPEGQRCWQIFFLRSLVNISHSHFLLRIVELAMV